MPVIETEEAARRLARAIASDLSLYNEEKITQGVKDDDLFGALEEEIEEGAGAVQQPGLTQALWAEPVRPCDHRHPRSVERARAIEALVASSQSWPAL